MEPTTNGININPHVTDQCTLVPINGYVFAFQEKCQNKLCQNTINKSNLRGQRNYQGKSNVAQTLEFLDR